jgi:hypothetical protein
MTLNIMAEHCYAECHFAVCHYAECHGPVNNTMPYFVYVKTTLIQHIYVMPQNV